jgi:hypothetical protein
VTTDIQALLDQYADITAQLDALTLAYEDQRRALVPPEIQRELDDLATEHNVQVMAAQDNAGKLYQAIKAAVLEAGVTVKGAHFQAVYTKPRAVWDGKALEGFAAAHPEILSFRTDGAPSVSIRKI